MLDPSKRRRRNFRPGRPLSLADGQPWVLPDPGAVGDEDDAAYGALLSAIVEADRPDDLLRAELALAIHLIDANYDLSPLILGALLDFPKADPALARFQSELHELAMDHARAYRCREGNLSDPPYVRRFPRGFGLRRRAHPPLSA